MVWGIVKHETGTQGETWCHAEEFELTSEGSGQFMKDLRYEVFEFQTVALALVWRTD